MLNSQQPSDKSWHEECSKRTQKSSAKIRWVIYNINMTNKKFFITTAIDYTNDVIHIGHSYQKILADCLARYHRLIGDKVYFLTGTDEHGQKVEKSAKEHSIDPTKFV